MNQRPERLAAEIHAVLAEIIARGEIRDSRVRDVGIVTITHVHVTGDLNEARVAFTVFGADAATLERVRQGLNAARVYLQQVLARRLRTRKTALLKFETDRSLDNAFRVDGLLREAAARDQASAPPASESTDVDHDVDHKAADSDSNADPDGDGDVGSPK